MLGVFNKSVAKSPEALQQSPDNGAVSALKDGFLATHFSSVHSASASASASFHINLAYSSAPHNPLLPRLFGVVDNVFCLFEGHIENIAQLTEYGLNKKANEVSIVIEAYRSLRDRGPYLAEDVVRDIQGKYAFILFDATSQSTFIASDADGNVPFFWGTDAEGHLVVSTDCEIVKLGCGCFFTSSGGLKSYENSKELKAVPRVDSSGEICGITFKVDEESHKEKPKLLRVGSDSNWSHHY